MSMGATPGSARGFTFIEAAVVVAVLGIVAALAAPSFRDYIQRSTLRGAANEAYTDLMFARSEAVQANASRRVTFTTTGYVISNDLAVGAAGYTAFKTVTLPAGVTLAPSGSPFRVTFEAVRATAATTPAGGTLSFAATGLPSDATLQLSVNVLGRVSLCSPSGRITGVPSC